MTLPDFLCIGAAKAGTTWLYHNLSHHPDFWMPPIKELQFFNRSPKPFIADLIHPNKERRFLLRRWLFPAIQDMVVHPKNSAWHLKYFGGIRTNQWYSSLFSQASQKITGDITPGYSLLSEEEILSISHLVPHARIIFMLRDPIDRIWSHAAMYFDRFGKNGLENASRDAIKTFIFKPYVMGLSEYEEILDRWQSYFPANQWHLIFFEELQQSSLETYQKTERFFGVQSDYSANVKDKVHTHAYPPVPDWILDKLIPHFAPIVKKLHTRFDNAATEKWMDRYG